MIYSPFRRKKLCAKADSPLSSGGGGGRSAMEKREHMSVCNYLQGRYGTILSDVDVVDVAVDTF